MFSQAVSFHYVPASVDITSSRDNIFKRLTRYTTIDIRPLGVAFEKYMRAKDSLEDVRFNFYEPLGLETHTFIVSNHTQMNSLIISATFDRFSRMFGSPEIRAERGGQSIAFTHRDHYEDLPGKGPFKIHLQVKHEYILHCIIQLGTLCDSFSTNPLLRRHSLSWKVCLFNRPSYSYGIDGFPHHDNGLKEINGGVAGTFVIYASSDAEITTFILRELLRVFHNEEMGLMNIRSTESLTPGHIRLNSIISYANTDRNTMIGRLRRNITEFPDVPNTLPPWLATMAGECTPVKKDELNTESQRYLGMDICDDAGAGINYQTMCNTPPRTPEQKYCYMPELTLNPRMLLAPAVVEAPTVSAAAEAAVTEAVVEAAEAVAESTAVAALAGGFRKTKNRRLRKRNNRSRRVKKV
jgi:hypothetical protein